MDTLHILAGVTAFATGAAGIGAVAAVRATRLATRLEQILGRTVMIEDLILARNEFRTRAALSERRLANEQAQSGAYRETLDRLGEEDLGLRREIAELREERDMLETELLATKLALEAEERQADTWARTATTLGYNVSATTAGALSAAA